LAKLLGFGNYLNTWRFPFVLYWLELYLVYLATEEIALRTGSTIGAVS
jgi:hypothetical protein